MSVRWKQGLVILLGTLVTAAMLGLGFWQARVFENQENESAQRRAAQPPVALLDHVNPDGTVGDVFGKRGTVTGEYLPQQQLLIGAADETPEVVTALLLPDGRVVPVLRGTLPSAGAAIPPPPTGRVEVTGIFLPSQPGSDQSAPAGQLGSVRLPEIAQLWPQQLLPGYLTLDSSTSAAQELGPARVSLPGGEGSVQNAGYALQWWVFAGFAALMTHRFTVTIGRRGSLGTLSDQEE